MSISATIREKLHVYIDEAPSDKIEALFVLLKEEIGMQYDQHLITELYSRRQRHQENQSKSYTVEESLKVIRNQPPA